MIVDQGTMIFLITLSGIWPPVHRIEHVNMVDGGAVRCSMNTDGKLEASVSRGKEIIIHAKSEPLKIGKLQALSIVVTWILPNDITIWVSDKIVATSRKGIDTSVDFSHIEPYNPTNPKNYDAENLEALKVRKLEMSTSKGRPGRQRGDTEYLFSALEAECQQIEDLLSLINQGRKWHTFGLSSRLRLLIAKTRFQKPLLQSCAAILDEPLFIYTGPPAAQMFKNMPNMMPEWVICPNISPISSADCKLKTDIDVWLNMETCIVNEEYFSSLKMLKSISDTVGSHLDHDIDPAVSILMSMQVVANKSEGTQLTNYIKRVGEATLHAGTNLLKTWGGRAK